ncbi:MAG: Fe-S cluster assembly scaffold SufA [Rickettsiales bacterium]|nr:Fe-S cluster assembly scaffold SufA [Rickettsiales bacterium]
MSFTSKLNKAPLLVTERAKDQIKTLLQQRGKECIGVRIGTRTKGCNGLSYTLEYAEKQERFDEVVDCQDFKILIDPKAILFILGSEMDFQTTELESGFVFKNPNEKGRCGCGESFHV